MVYVTINYWAVLLAGVLSMALGALWYSPYLFGMTWVKLSKFSTKDLARLKKSGSVKRSYTIMFLTTLVTGYVLSHFVDYIGAASLLGGVQLGFWIWLGIAAPLQLGMVLWEGRPVKLYFLITGHTLANLVLVSAVLAVWP